MDRGRSESVKLASLSPKSSISQASCDENSVLNQRFQRKYTRQFDIKEFLKLSTPFAMVNAETVKIKSVTNLKKQVKCEGYTMIQFFSCQLP